MGNDDWVAPRRAAGPAPGSAAQRQVSVLRSGLVEVLVVMTVIGLLSAIVVAGVMVMKERTTRFACDADVSTVALAADAYYAEHRAFPASPDALQFDGYLRPGARDEYAVRYVLDPDGRGYRVTGQTTSGRPCRTATSGEHGPSVADDDDVGSSRNALRRGQPPRTNDVGPGRRTAPQDGRGGVYG